MNKKITWRTIRMIALQSALTIAAVTAVGGAMLVHDEFKATANQKNRPVNSTSVSEKAEKKKNKTINEKYAYSYQGFNPKVIDTSVDISQILLNTDFCLPKDYSPNLASAISGSDVMLDSRVAPYYQAMYDAAKNDGIYLNPIAGYRSAEEQKEEFDELVDEYISDEMSQANAVSEAARDVMLPLASEHNAGLAVDICSHSASFEYTDEFEWLCNHAAEYGFILRYPKGEEKQKLTKVNFQPWHFRFVGIDAALEIESKGLTLEEYAAK